MILSDAIFSLLGSSVPRIYPGRAPQGTALPYSVYLEVSTQPSQHKDGQASVLTFRVQISIFHNTSRDAQTLADTVRGILDHYAGTAAGVKVDQIRFENQFTQYEEDAQVHSVIQEYTIRAKQ